MWHGWKTALVIVQPDTVVSWQRQSFQLVLALEKPMEGIGTSTHRPRDETTDPDDEPGQSALGRSAHPW